MGSMEEEWIESVDSRTGRTFYANPKTRETRWEKPATTAAAAAAPTLSLPSNWEEMSDEATGRVFYVDHVNKITQWNHPGMTTTTTTTTNHSQPQPSQPASFSSSAINPYTNTNTSSGQEGEWENILYNNSGGGGNNVSVRSSSMMSLSLSFLRPLDFVVKEVPDEMRSKCPSCDSEFSFKKYKRRHHCRLCGDVVCHDCSPHKVLLPLEGDQYSKPVRVCNACHVDVERGDYFSMRRYLTPLSLYQLNNNNNNKLSTEEEESVCAALLAMAQDLNACLQDPSTFTEKVTLSANQLVPAIVYYVGNHNYSREVRDYAITTLSVLLSVGNVVDRNEYLQEAIRNNNSTVIVDSLQLLEQENRPMAVQKQIVRALYYLTSTRSSSGGELCERVLRNMLDGCMGDNNNNHESVSLQRWAVATLQNVISVLLDVNADFDFVSCGAVMILCTLLSSDDADIRNHATAALTNTLYTSPAQSAKIANAIYESGALQISLVQMLLSADTNIVTMACTFTKCLLLLTPQNFPVPSGMVHALIQIVNYTSRPLDLRSMSLQILALLKAQDPALSTLIWQQVTTCQYWASRELSGWHLVESCCVLSQYNTATPQPLLRYWIQYLEHCPSHLPSAFAEDQTVPCTLLSAIRQPFTQQQQQQQEQDLLELTKEALDAGIANLLVGILQSKGNVLLHAGACHIVSAIHTSGTPTLLPLALTPQVFAIFQSTALNVQTYSDDKLPQLLEASLLAMGSICGAKMNIHHHSLNHYLTTNNNNTTTNTSEDQKQMAQMTYQVLDNNTFLPALLVGAYGEGCIWAALRLTFAISKLHPLTTLPSGLMDILQTTTHPSIKSMVLGILRHYSSSQNTTTSPLLRDVIPLLSSDMESIWTMEALSQNPALHSTLMTHSLPSICQYLTTTTSTSTSTSKDELQETTVIAALRMVQQLVVSSSGAVAVARAGMGTPLCQLICTSNSQQHLALELLHSLSKHALARTTDTPGTMDLFHSGVPAAAVYAITTNNTSTTPMALEILYHHLQDTTNNNNNNEESMSIMVQAMTRQKRFLQLLCSTLLLTTTTTTTCDLVTPSLYGTPLSTTTNNTVTGFERVEDAMNALFLFLLANNNNNELFWQTFYLSNVTIRKDDEMKQHATLVASCSSLLSQLSSSSQNIPQRLLTELQTHINYLLEYDTTTTTQEEEDPIFALLQQYQVPQICLQLCADNTPLRSYAFSILEIILMEHPDDIVPLMIADAPSLSTCLDLLDCSNDDEEESKKMSRIVAQVIGTCAERGQLAPAVEQFQLRSAAIASLSAACLMDPINNNNNDEEDEDEYVMATEDGGSSVTKSCLHALVGILEGGVSVTEAQAIAKNLGAKLSNVVLHRFAQHAAEDQCDNNNITNAPEVALLCQLASNPQALPDLCANGGLEALSLVANEGELSAIHALSHAAQSEPTLVLNVEGHISIMHVLIHKNNNEVQLPCMQLLATLCSTAGTKKIAEADDCHDLIVHASSILCQLHQHMTQQQEQQEQEQEPSNLDTEEQKERITAFWERKQMEKKDSCEYALELASLSILSSLLHVTQEDILSSPQKELIQSIYFFTTYHQQIHLQFAALSFLWNALPYIATDDDHHPLSVDSLSSTLLAVVEARDLSDKSSYNNIGVETKLSMGYGHTTEVLSLNPNLITARALSLLQELYCQLPPNHNTICQLVSSQLAKLLEHTIATNQTKNKKRILFQTNSGRLAWELTSLSLLMNKVQDQDQLLLFVASMMSLIVNPVQDSDEYWNGAMTNAIQFLSMYIHQKGISLLQEAQPKLLATLLPKKKKQQQGSATTRMIQSLKSFTPKEDATRFLMAQRILQRISQPN